ncbi:hypothetical protein MNBD_ALPHA08-1630 [hydrothermal vent metagenome]|uniref:Uncharacterized protein n=1 Tax=hydrothermal vent metagenome TaxID=652676 RepID=A0A3B0R7W1_9ZZZZ
MSLYRCLFLSRRFLALLGPARARRMSAEAQSRLVVAMLLRCGFSDNYGAVADERSEDPGH